MIVMIIFGIFSAAMLPNYFRARALAEASGSILEAVAFAEQCSVAHKSGLRVVVDPPGGPARNCNGTSYRIIQSRRWSSDATGVQCLGVSATSTDRQAMLNVSGNRSAVIGTITCTFRP